MNIDYTKVYAGVAPACRQAGNWYMITVYAIKSINEPWIYVGISRNLTRRFKEHNDKRVRSTKHRAPYTLIYTELQNSISEARVREKYLKSGSGKEFLKTL